MNRFRITDLPLDGLTLVTRGQIGDHRGFLTRLFCADELAMAGWKKPIAQVNHTFTAKKGSVRGLHFQCKPHAEMKLVTCIRGEVWDVAVDLRPNSRTFLQWHAERLSSDNGCAMLIPEGFAHGFQALVDDVEMLYCHSHVYASGAESGLNPIDPRISVAWPLSITEISTRDAGHPLITAEFKGVQI